MKLFIVGLDDDDDGDMILADSVRGRFILAGSIRRILLIFWFENSLNHTHQIDMCAWFILERNKS